MLQEKSGLSFRAKKVTLPVDWETDEGEVVTSLVLEEVTEESPSASSNPFTGYARDVYGLLEELDPFGLSGASCTVDQLREKLAQRWVDLKANTLRQRSTRCLKEIEKAGKIRLKGRVIEVIPHE